MRSGSRLQTLLGTMLPQKSGHFSTLVRIKFKPHYSPEGSIPQVVNQTMAQGFPWKVEGPLVFSGISTFLCMDNHGVHRSYQQI